VREGGDFAAEFDSATALFTWLRAVGTHAAANRGLAPSLMRGARDGNSAGGPALGTTCHTMIINAGGVLLDEAVRRMRYVPASSSPTCSNSSAPSPWPPSRSPMAQPRPTG
jgi:hypothetical protein